MISSVGINHKSLPDLPELYLVNYYYLANTVVSEEAHTCTNVELHCHTPMSYLPPPPCTQVQDPVATKHMHGATFPAT